MADPLGDGTRDNGPLDQQPLRSPRPESKVRIPLLPSLSWFEEMNPLMRGDIHLLSGAAGSGKSILFTQIGLAVAQHSRVGYVLTEQSQAAHTARMMNMLCERDGGDIQRILQREVIEDGVSPELLPEFIATHVLRPGDGQHPRRPRRH